MRTTASICMNDGIMITDFRGGFHISNVLFKMIFSLLEALVLESSFHQLQLTFRFLSLWVNNLMCDSIFYNHSE